MNNIYYEGEFINIFENKNKIELNPKIISKFPPKNSNYNGIIDEIVVNHTFPNGLNIIYDEKQNKAPTHFFFELDNLLFNYSIEEKNIYSKMYFTCLEIYESSVQYFKYKNEIKKSLNNKKIEINDNITELKDCYSHIYIPKVICFSSVLPFYKELYNLLNIIFKIYSENSNNKILPIEKLIEQIVLGIPIPIISDTHVELLLKLNNLEIIGSNSLTDFFKINFPLFNLEERNLQLYYTNSALLIFQYFSIDDVLKIFNSILLEIPILFFCNDKTVLSSLIEIFISLLSPFKYVVPYISILPKNLYGLISTEKKFLFGINEDYNYSFFENKDIEIEKNIIVINLNNNKNESKIELICKESNEGKNCIVIEDDLETKNNDYNYNEGECYIQDDYVVYNGIKTYLINIEIPYTKKKILYEDISNFLTKIKSKKNEEDDYNYKIQSIFYKFFVYLLAGYTDYYLNSKYFYESITKNCGNEILYKKDIEKGMNDSNFVKEIYNYEDFISKYPKEGQVFYFAFFQTKMFVNFLRERIYLNDKINSMAYKQFDQLTFLKKHEDFRKKKENKGIYENFKKKVQDKIKKEKIKEISIIIVDFHENEFKQIINKDKKQILMKYAQLIKKENNKLLIDYYLFPKLFYDDEFFNIKYENSYFMNGIEMPNSRGIEDYKLKCSSNNDEYYKLRRYIFPPALIDKLPSTNNSKINFEISSSNYIYFNWIILLCCSLWYCEPIERIIRLEEILVMLDKLNYIEEIVLKLLYITFLKYGKKSQCIRVHEKIVSFYGYSNYFFLNLFCLKLCEKPNKEEIENQYLYKKAINFGNEDKDKENKFHFKERSFILGLDSFIEKRISLPFKKNKFSHRMTRSTTNFSNLKFNKHFSQNNGKEKNYKEKIVFSSEQFCPKCQNFYPFDFEEIKKQKLSKIIYYYKCSKCKTIKNDVTIKYQILMYNIFKKELFITKMGEFKLLPPNRLYQELMYHLTSKKEWKINIENIFTEKQINLINFIYYFSSEGISFDFLIPFKTIRDENIELIKNNLGAIISDINKRRFTILEINETEKINKSLTMNTDDEDFIPIDISNNNNLNRYYDLVPCLINYYYDIYHFNQNEEVEKEGNEEENDIINNNEDGQIYFTINKI